MKVIDGRGYNLFPVTYNLKVIMQKHPGEPDNKTILENILLKLNIDHSEWHKKPDTGTKYDRYSVKVTLEKREDMDFLYQELDREELVKAAI